MPCKLNLAFLLTAVAFAPKAIAGYWTCNYASRSDWWVR